jgi:hypothetical protein
MKFKSSDVNEIAFIDSELDRMDAEIEECNKERREINRPNE